MIAMGAVPALVVGVTLAAVQQCGGIDTITDYAPTITERTGLSAANSIYYSIAIGQGETFWIFGAIALAGLAFVARFVPEAKGRGFDEADADLRRRFGRPPPEGTPE